MNNAKHPVKQAVKEFYAPKKLSDSQHQVLHTLQEKLQQEQTPSKIFFVLPWAGSIAASFLLFFVVFGFMQTPAVITAAYTDIRKDAGLNNGMPSILNQWMDENGIGSVPQKYPVEMSKFCSLNQYQTTHLRIAGSEQGMMHLFFHYGNRPMHWFNRTGTVDEMNWKLIKIREDLTVIVLYTDNMRESAIQNILEKMLPELLS